MFRIAHVSDLHVLSPTAKELRRILFNKRVTGLANLLSKRGRVYRSELLRAVLDEAVTQADHLVVTGDITNLSLEPEYEEAVRLLDAAARRVEVSVVPGNHDIYLPATLHTRRFPHHFTPFMRSDLPELAADLPAGHFPWVKLRGAVALIGLSSAVPRPPFVSAGLVGRTQLAALARVLALPEVAGRTPVLLVHHSPFDARFPLEQLRGGLVDARALRRTLEPLGHGLLLYGHLHVRRCDPLRTRHGTLRAFCASAAPLEHPDEHVRAGFNLYTVDDTGRVLRTEAVVLDAATQRFQRRAFPCDGARA